MMKQIMRTAIAGLLITILMPAMAQQPGDPAMEIPRLNMNPLPEYSYDSLDYGMTIGIEQTRKGRIWACWVGGGDNEDAFFVLSTSDDKGSTWSKPRMVIDPHNPALRSKRRTIVGTLWLDPDGKLWLFFDQAMTYFDGRGGNWYTTCSNPDDENPVWTTPKYISFGATLNKPTVLSNGNWILPVSLWDRSKIKDSLYANAHRELDSLRKAHVFISADKGKTWTRSGAVAFPDPHFDEHHIVERKNGSLWMTARTKNGIHESVSTDNGKTWSPPVKYMEHVSSRHFIRRLASGNLLLVKHGEIKERTAVRSKLMAFISADDGKTWKGGLMLDERRGISYPDGFQAPDGTIYISYDRNREMDGEVLMVRFTEKDVLNKHVAGKPSPERKLISRPLALDKLSPPSVSHDTMTDPALVVPVINTKPLPMYNYDRLDYGMNRGIARTNGGRIWSCWAAGGDNADAFLLLNYSDDGGSTWSAPKVAIDSHDPALNEKRRIRVGNLWTDSEGNLWVFFDQVMTTYDGRAGVWYSVCKNPDSNQPQWSTPVRIWHGSALNKPIVLSNGDWALPVTLWDRSKIKDSAYLNAYRELDEYRKAHVFISRDKGKTWIRRGAVAFPKPDFDEHHIVERKNGTLWMTARTRTGIYESVSADQGGSWSVPAKYMEHINSRHFITRLASGRLLLVRHGAIDEKTTYRSKLMAFVSDDDGLTWKGGLMLDGRRGISYPDGFQAPDGKIYISYDHNRQEDGEIWLARFTEQEVLNGGRSSGNILISRPQGLDKVPAPSLQLKVQPATK